LAQSRAGWALGFEDEVWFSRFAQPALHSWAAPGEPLRLAMHAADPADPETKALACYGLWLPERERMLLRFVAGRPVSPVTCAFLAWAAQQMAAEDVRVLVVIWDKARRLTGQCRLACQPRGPWLDQGPQPSGQTRWRLPPADLPPTEQEPVAQPDRAPLGARQTRRRRAATQAHRRRAPAPAL